MRNPFLLVPLLACPLLMPACGAKDCPEGFLRDNDGNCLQVDGDSGPGDTSDGDSDTDTDTDTGTDTRPHLEDGVDVGKDTLAEAVYVAATHARATWEANALLSSARCPTDDAGMLPTTEFGCSVDFVSASVTDGYLYCHMASLSDVECEERALGADAEMPLAVTGWRIDSDEAFALIEPGHFDDLLVEVAGSEAFSDRSSQYRDALPDDVAPDHAVIIATWFDNWYLDGETGFLYAHQAGT